MVLNKKERIIIVGCGRLGGRLANRMSDKGYQVVLIDSDAASFDKLPDSFGGFTVVANGIDLDTLKYADIEEAQLFVAATGDDNMNNLIAQIASRVYGVPNVYVRFDDPEKERLIRGFNIHGIYPFKLSLAAIEESLIGESDTDDEEDDDV